MWLAIAAMAVVSVPPAQARHENGSAYTNPVLEFLSAHQHSGGVAAHSVPRLLRHASVSQARALSFFGPHPGAWRAILPVFFIGVVAPLSLISPRSVLCLGRAPAPPASPFSFQRPPPFSLL